ncbi:Pimeloyl-[acyl-carrier protein] methyl ester esterase [Buchnera aphidicola (Cinara cuneomaculata)]|uniref:Pimeloyl-[acyl-carrier protein] methyl ester esterase n=1 Tax=Buchnera aphidicola (Cinara cuneomaculata) TaxID=1660040 RepID=A0A451CYL0_9GAMM|nr:alpha/beta fold hydrolase [Buchnera aphidicola]VFP78355.1 Pimeloyl-[acyl-carrier protein] methyl ester esterase [Buchnera aphidicola (Cinara cuneomaculata)]
MQKIIRQSIFGNGKIHLVLLHGWGLNSVVWNKIIPILKRNFTLHIIDLPGFGKNIHCPIMNFEQTSTRLLKIVTKKAIWLGWSLGGLFVHYLGLHYPKHTQAVIYTASSPFFIQEEKWPGISINLLNSIKKNILTDYEKFLLKFIVIHVIDININNIYNFKIKKFLFKKYPSPTKQAIEIGYHWLTTIDYRNTKLSPNIPTFRIYGELDNIVPIKIKKIIDNLWNNNNSCVITGAKHAPFLSHPIIFCNILNEFIKNLSMI